MSASIWDFDSLDNQADQANTNVAKNIREGVYTFRCDDIVETKTQAGDAKIEVKLSIVGQDDGQADLIGISRKQHFVIGHKKAEVAAGYKKDFLGFLKASGVDLTKVKNDDDFFLAIRKVKTTQAISRYHVKPQEKDAKYLDWRLVTAAAPATASTPAAHPTAAQIDAMANAAAEPAKVEAKAVASTPAKVDDDLFGDIAF